MKKFLLTAAVLLCTAFGARAQSVAADIAGNYTGDLYISLAAPITDETEPITGQQVTLTAGEDGTVTLALYNFEFGGAPLGDIVVPDLPVSVDADGNVRFGEIAPVSLVLGGIIEATAQVNPTTSLVSDSRLTADIDVMWTNAGEVPVPIYVRFDGEQAAAPAPDPSPAADIAGDYTGDLYISLAAPITDETEPITGQQVTLTAGEDGTVTLALYNFEFGGAPLGDIVVPDLPVSVDADGNVRFGEIAPVSLVLGGIIEATAQVNPTTSLVSDSRLTADIDVMWTNAGEVPVPIYVRFVSDGTSGIESVTARPARSASGIFTIDGRRVNATGADALPAGLYIIDGRKTFVK